MHLQTKKLHKSISRSPVFNLDLALLPLLALTFSLPFRGRSCTFVFVNLDVRAKGRLQATTVSAWMGMVLPLHGHRLGGGGEALIRSTIMDVVLDCGGVRAVAIAVVVVVVAVCKGLEHAGLSKRDQPMKHSLLAQCLHPLGQHTRAHTVRDVGRFNIPPYPQQPPHSSLHDSAQMRPLHPYFAHHRTHCLLHRHPTPRPNSAAAAL